MLYRSYDNTRMIHLLACPCCGCDDLKIIHIGNDRTKSRKLTIQCKCGIRRTDAAIRHGFDWLEDISQERWNTRHEVKNERA